MEYCPCGSGRGYGECCGPYLAGSLPAPTAESLMRSRYTAYVRSNVDYIVSTCTETEGIDLESTRKWSEKSNWLGLKIHRSVQGQAEDSTGEVEFSATYVLDGLREEHREIAKFEKKDGRWLYSEGEVVPRTVVRESPKVGRNDPCPCGSGKKYKKCCGAGT
jgi:SEC-C motif-containing protein